MKRIAPQVIAICLAIAALGQVAANSRRPMENLTTSVGDSRGDVRLTLISAGRERTATDKLENILRTDCEYVMMIHPDCYWCDVYAPMWSGVDSVTVGQTIYGLSWISIDPTKDKTEAFLTKHNITTQAFRVASPEDALLIGVNATPSLWVFRDGVVLATNVGIEPEKLLAAPTQCSEPM